MYATHPILGDLSRRSLGAVYYCPIGQRPELVRSAARIRDLLARDRLLLRVEMASTGHRCAFPVDAA